MSRSRPALHALGALACTTVGAIALSIKGPMPVVAVSCAQSHSAPFVYMLVAFPFYGALWGDVVWRRIEGRPLGVFTAQLLWVGGLAAVRLLWALPVSGHVLLQIVFCGLAWQLPASNLRRFEILSGSGVLAALLWTKLAIWSDFVTPVTAALIALLTLWVGRASERRFDDQIHR